MTIYVGIDPGKSGGIGFLGSNGLTCWTVKLADATERDTFDALADAYRAAEGDIVAVLEEVHAMPKQGVTSTFTFGQSYGALRMALIAASIPFETVTPVKWQTFMRCRTGGDKNVSKARAQELFPNVKITNAIADALLLAEFCRRTR